MRGPDNRPTQTMTDKPLKPLPAFVQRVKQGVAAFAKAEPFEAPMSEPPVSSEEVVRRHWRLILEKWMIGEPMEEIGQSLQPDKLTGAEIRRAFKSDPELRDRFAAAKGYLADHLMDRSVASALKAEKNGDYGQASDRLLKLAGVLDKASYGTKVYVAGDLESPIQHAHTVDGQVKLEMSPSDAYMRLLEAGR